MLTLKQFFQTTIANLIKQRNELKTTKKETDNKNLTLFRKEIDHLEIKTKQNENNEDKNTSKGETLKKKFFFH